MGIPRSKSLLRHSCVLTGSLGSPCMTHQQGALSHMARKSGRGLCVAGCSPCISHSESIAITLRPSILPRPPPRLRSTVRIRGCPDPGQNPSFTSSMVLGKVCSFSQSWGFLCAPKMSTPPLRGLHEGAMHGIHQPVGSSQKHKGTCKLKSKTQTDTSRKGDGVMTPCLKAFEATQASPASLAPPLPTPILL